MLELRRALCPALSSPLTVAPRRRVSPRRLAAPRRLVAPILVALAVVALVPAAPAHGARARKAEAAPVTPGPAVDPTLFQSLEWREVGPYRGGRSAAVTGIPGDTLTFYFGATGGGVWKTTDGGQSWQNVSDGFFGGSIGAVAVSAWDPNVVYVGTGETTVRGNVSHGDGMWKSTDAGKTWKHIGLADSRHISRVRIHPKNPDLVYVAVLGHLFGPNEERGVFRSRDGGASWEKVLHVSPEAGAVDLAMDPTNPRVLYASFWRVRRTPWSLESGGEGSGLWKSTDGGDTWEELTPHPGLPRGTLGISGITVSPTHPDNLYAIVEAEEGGVFRSRDGGATWQRTNSERSLRQRAWYYSRIYADPADEEAVYVLNVQMHHSKDGGRTFTTIRTPHSDNHDLWIDPADPRRMIESNDGGANVSFDGGENWSTQANQPTAQMYRVATDDDFPYRLLGGQQDNSALRIRSRSAQGSVIGDRDWEPTAGGESGHVVAKPGEPDVVYGGSYGGFLMRVDHRTGAMSSVDAWPDNPMGWGAAELKYRFQWNFPLFFSPHDPDLLHAAANVLWTTRDGGQSWQVISPDLTRNDKSKQGPSGGPITKDNTSIEYYGTIFAACESPHEAGVLWTGSDDGLVHLSRDGGASWANVTPKGLPEWAMINSIEPHPTVPGGLYLAATRYKLDDFTPYLYATTDWGETWRRIDSGIARDHFTRVVRADPGRPGLLYAGTERGVYVSFDDGGHWQSLQLGLPLVPITDLAVKEGDLLAATQGRGYWILDDLSVLHQLEPEIAAAPLHLFAPRPAHRLISGSGFRPPRGRVAAGTNPPDGVVFHYYLGEEPGEDVKVELDILDADGTLVRTYTRKPKEGEGGGGEGRGRRGQRGEGEDARQLPAARGANRFAWDLSYPAAEGFPGIILWAGDLDGPKAVPGTWQARLRVGEESATVPFEILPDPRSTATAEDRQAQFEFVLGIRDKLTEVHRAIGHIREVRGQLDDLKQRLDGEDEAAKPVLEAAKNLDAAMTTVEEALYQTKNQSSQDPLNFPIRLNDKLGGVAGLASLGDGRPTAQSYAVRDELSAAIDAELATLAGLWAEDLPELNRLAREADVPLVSVKEKKEE